MVDLIMPCKQPSDFFMPAIIYLLVVGGEEKRWIVVDTNDICEWCLRMDPDHGWMKLELAKAQR